LARLVPAHHSGDAGPRGAGHPARTGRKKLQTGRCRSAYPNCATYSLTFSGADGTALSIFSTGPNGEGIINSTPCAVTIGNEARRCRSSIYNCSTKQVLLILANIVDLNSDSIGILNEKTILGLASISGSLIRERNEVAAFVYVSTTSVSQASAAGFCFSSFDVLHLAIAESRLSNRAWQVLERSLLPLPYEQWDA